MKFQGEIEVENQELLKYSLLYLFKEETSLVLLDGNNFTNSSFQWLIAAGAEDSISSGAEGAFEALQDFHHKHKDWIFGHLNYDLKNGIEDLESNNFDGIKASEMSFFLPKYMFRLQANRLSIYRHENQKHFEIQNFEVYFESIDVKNSFNIRPRMHKQDYIDQVKKIKAIIQKGEIYEMNYCQEFYANTNLSDPIGIFRKLNLISKAPFACYYKIHNIHLLCSSPERFLKKTGNRLLSQPIKGTQKRGCSFKEDERLKKEFYKNPKERSENIMIVDLVRNDLSRVASSGSVSVDELFGIHTFTHLHQMISSISCKISENKTLKDILSATFPMGSMTGAPKISAMNYIENTEETKRGMFSGSVGYIDPDGDFDLNVIIRSILYNDEKKYISFIVGGAITIGSNPQKEYEECILKAKALFKVLN